MDTPIRILCVDDHPLMRQGIIRTVGLHADLAVIAEAATGEDAVRLFQLHDPDVTLMDLQLPGMSGLEAIRAILRQDPNARIIVLTIYQGDEDIYRAVQAGAVGYVLKDTIPEDLVQMIRDVHQGNRVISHVAAQLIRRDTHPALTTRELEVLELMAGGMRNKEMAIKLHVSDETIHAHVRSILTKLNVHDRAAAVTVALKQGILHIS